jgi:hypothetical protein
MTWSAKLKVRDIDKGPAHLHILALAHVDDGDAAILSNTEGKIRAVELRVILDEDETALRAGDVIHAYGTFSS